MINVEIIRELFPIQLTVFPTRDSNSIKYHFMPSLSAQFSNPMVIITLGEGLESRIRHRSSFFLFGGRGEGRLRLSDKIK